MLLHVQIASTLSPASTLLQASHVINMLCSGYLQYRSICTDGKPITTLRYSCGLAGQPNCAEDPEAARHVTRFLAQSVARACRFNKSHACFNTDLQAYIKDPMVGRDFKKALTRTGYLQEGMLERVSHDCCAAAVPPLCVESSECPLWHHPAHKPHRMTEMPFYLCRSCST